MTLFLSIVEILFGAVGLGFFIRAAWLLARGEYRHGFINVGLAVLAFAVAVGFFLARGLFVTVA